MDAETPTVEDVLQIVEEKINLGIVPKNTFLPHSVFGSAFVEPIFLFDPAHTTGPFAALKKDLIESGELEKFCDQYGIPYVE